MALEDAIKENTAAVLALTAALAAGAGATKASATAEKPATAAKPAADKPAAAAKPATKPKGPTLDDVIAKATAFLNKDHEDLDDRKAFMKTVLTKIGAPKASAAKPEFFPQIIEWLDAREADAEFAIDGEADDAMV